MMTKHTSRVRAWLVASLTIPIFIGALFLFSTKVIAKENVSNLMETTQNETINLENDKANYYKNATFIFEDENGQKIRKTYAELTTDELAMLIPPPKTPVAKRPSAQLLSDWKNKTAFAVWIDKKVIDNKEISNYDIVHYTQSFVYKNARSSRFPQANQIRLFTASGFENLKNDLNSPLSEDAILYFKKGSNQLINKVSKKGANAINNAPKEKKVYPQDKKDIVVMIGQNGMFHVNYKKEISFEELDENIKSELSQILHKRARNSLIVYHESQKESIAKATAILKAHKIYDIETIDIENIPPPPPPAPEKLEKAPKLSPQEKRNVAHMHENIKGEKVETMQINGKKHFYVVKNGVKFIYNEKSQLVDEKGKPIPPPPPPPAPKKKDKI